jgi:hypothetical protein
MVINQERRQFNRAMFFNNVQRHCQSLRLQRTLEAPLEHVARTRPVTV